jgi:hypothetical protein
MSVVDDFEKELLNRAKNAYSKWHRVDLHNHSPSSFDYAGSKASAIEDSAKQIRETGLSIVMFTDHGKLPDESFVKGVSQRSGALIIAGIELNIFADAFGKPKGKIHSDAFFHLLVGFNPNAEYDAGYWVKKVYEECGRATRGSGHQSIEGVDAPIEKVLECLSKAGALLIPAHLHSGKDAFRSRSLDDIYDDEHFLRFVPQFSALEVTDKKTASFFDGNQQETKRITATCIQSSDSHKADDLGWRPTWVQMQAPTFDELSASLRMRSRVSLDMPQEPPSYVEGLHIDGGFLKDCWIPFSPHCNMLIGVKGSGKTAALECLRFVLGAEVPKSNQDSVRAHLNHVLSSVGRVRCLVKRADATSVLIERSMANPQQFQLSFKDGRTEIISQSQALGFPTQILGWHEIEHAATDSGIRRKYLDTIAGQDAVMKLESAAKGEAQQIKYVHEQAAGRYQSFVTLNAQVTAQEELRKGLQELNDAQLIELRNKYELAISHREEMTRLVESLQATQQTRTQRLDTLFPFGAEMLIGSSPLSVQVDKLKAGLTDLWNSVTEFGQTIGLKIDETIQRSREILIEADSEFARFAKDYEAAVNLLPPDKRSLLEAHRQVLESTRELSALQGQRAQAKQDVENLLGQLIGSCDRVAEILTERTELRSNRLDAFAAGLGQTGVKLELLRLNNLETYNQYAGQYREGFNIFQNLKSGHPAANTMHKRLSRAYAALRENLISDNRWVFSHVEFAHYLTVFEEDDLTISFDPFFGSTASSGHRPLDQLSAGQRCTAMFPILLRLKDGPLVIDQPEDNLDNRHIASKISPAVTTDKRTRQIIMTSHNANLLVLSDPENVVVFEGKGAVGEIIEQGFLGSKTSAVTKHVLDILDGGERALALRNARYGNI